MNDASEPRENFEPPIDDLELQLQRLVDGELDDNASAKLMQQLEASEDGWRKCAIAFVESQLWDQSLAPQGLVLSGEAESDDTGVAGVEGPTDRVSLAKSPLQSDRSDSWRISSNHLLTLAACLTLAFFLGRQMAPQPTTTLAPRETVAETDAPSPLDPNLQVVGEFELMPRGNRNGQPHRLPVLAGSPDFTDSHSFPDSLFQQLRDAGYRVDRSTSFQSMPLGDQGVMFIPVEQVDLKAPPRFIP